MYFKTTVAIALIILCIASSCTKNLDGSGRIKKEERSIQPFTGIESNGLFRIVVEKGSAYQLTIEGEDNILPEIETVVNNGFLKVRYLRPNVTMVHGAVTVRVTTPTLNQIIIRNGNLISTDLWTTSSGFISVSGSGSATINLIAERLKTVISANGKVFLSGKASEGEFIVSGSGNLHAYDLLNTVASGIITGAGKCELNVSQKLNGQISGSGIIYYSGNPEKVEVAVSGTGKIVKL